MKKTLLVAALAAILLFAAAGSAFAVADQTDQARFGARVPVVMTPGTPPVYVSGGEGPFVDGNMTGTNTYKNWTPGLLGNTGVNGNSPHANYTTTTVKCVVCHAVHFAAPGNTPVAGNAQTADTLLRMRADQACAYCHATAGESVLGGPVYNGRLNNPTDLALVRAPGNQNVGHYLGSVGCNICHTSVHGAGDDTSVASLSGLLLNTFPLTGVNGDPAGTTTNMLDAIDYLNSKAQTAGFGNALPNSTGYYLSDNSVTAREQAVGVFCAECHNGAYATGEPGASTSIRSVASTAKFSGHRIAAAATTNWNSTGAVSSGDRTLGSVAWAAADNCKSCHDATDDYGDVAFPHAWGKSGTASSKDWLQMAARTGATKSSVGQAASADTADYQLQDGVCLKCHVSNTGAAGIGITF